MITGRPIAEAMAMGLPVAATNWSGHTLFLNESTGWPVPLDGLSCIDNVAKARLYARHRWAEPSVSGLRAIMRRLQAVGGVQDPVVAARASAGQSAVMGSYSGEQRCHLKSINLTLPLGLFMTCLLPGAGSYSQEAVAKVVQHLLQGAPLGQPQVDGNEEEAAVLQLVRAEPASNPDEALLRNLYDAAVGRLPTWLERVWANHVGWQGRWREFFCVLCYEAGERNAPGVGSLPVHQLPGRKSELQAQALGEGRASGAAGYGRYGGRAMCRVCKTKADGLSVIEGAAAGSMPVKRFSPRAAAGEADSAPAVAADIETKVPRVEGEDPRRRRALLKLAVDVALPVRRMLLQSPEQLASAATAAAVEGFWGGTLQTDRAQFESEWGSCHTEAGRGVLVALPYSDLMPCTLREKMFQLLKAMECANPGFNLHLALYDEPYHNEMDARKTKVSGRGVLAHIRNIVIERFLDPALHELVLWVDADVVEYPPNLVTLLHLANPGGVTAPTVFIEGSDTEEYHRRCRRGICGGKDQTERHYQFYDRYSFPAFYPQLPLFWCFDKNCL